MEHKKALLVILDGWGHGADPKVSAIQQANTPCIDALHENYPNSELVTFGEQVGLPKGQMGNSEVGHLNIGAGRIVYQELLRINNAIEDGSFFQNPTLTKTLDAAKAAGKTVHLMGLVSDGGVHSHIQHLKALCDMCSDKGLTDVFIHAFMDGRDTSPTAGVDYLTELLAHIDPQPVELASIIGRYYAMDRDKRWERIKLAYDLLVHAKGTGTTAPLQILKEMYAKGSQYTDEFLPPIVVTNEDGTPKTRIQEGDVVIFFNFRTDRPRQITYALTQQDLPDYDMKKLDLDFVTMTGYDDTFTNIDLVFTKDDLVQTLGEVLAKANKTQIRIAETEKYPHVTFFFNGGRETPFEGEERIMIPSPKVATYDLQPEMSAIEVTAAITKAMQEKQPDFVCINYANTDMVGHTGVFEAAMKAAETVDSCVSDLLAVSNELGYDAIIIADHGNSDYMINDDGTPHTAHTTNPVPCIYIQNGDGKKRGIQSGKLADVAPTILEIMGLPQPEKMTGKSLLV